TELRFASQGEFDTRSDGIPALTAVYGPFDWKSSAVYDNAQKYTALRNDEADVAPAYTTEGELINTSDFILLEDDRFVWPPYNLVPIVRNEILQEFPEIADALNRVSRNLNTALLTNLNAQIDVFRREIRDVASEFVNSMR
ncbi:MAG: glycine/betaine ABC transporter substrate-binding protein, partial [Defluviitaleaceae bacterium]|nr:glycine/betaine ABC transporter substrate-binding protein [Defluviitaleaceae bacterium]